MNDLREITERFWSETDDLDPLPRFQRYIQELLPIELASARDDGRLPEQAFDLLVLLVGHAFEPLLQSICAYRPSEVLLVLNRWYGSDTSGDDMARRLEKLVPYMKELNQLESVPSLRSHIVVDATPSAVFQCLLSELRDDWNAGRSVIVDITGAKKNMMAGAFFFAAYSNVPISYVDFDEYSEQLRRPYGFSCRIGPISNPYVDFQLRDWARVRRLYVQHSFRAARKTLRSVRRSMEESGYFNAEQVAAADRLARVLVIYEHWDNGNYSLAKEKIQGLKEGRFRGFSWPTAVEHLGDVWPHSEKGADARQAADQILDMHRVLELGDPANETTFYAHAPMLSVYIRDELARIDRLIILKEDFRSAFLRSAAVLEVLFIARLFVLWKLDQLRIESGDGRDDESLPSHGSSERQDLYSSLIARPGEVTKILLALRWRPGERNRQVKVRAPTALTAQGGTGEIGLRRAETAPMLDKFWEGTPLENFDLLRELRNKAIHTYLSVPRVVAGGALKMAQASWDEFEAKWMSLLDDASVPKGKEMVEEAEWGALCKACGIDFLPPYQEGD